MVTYEFFPPPIDAADAPAKPIAYRTSFRRLSSEAVFTLQSNAAFWRITDLLISTFSALLAFRFSPRYFDPAISQHSGPETVVPGFGIAFLVSGIALGLYDQASGGTFRSRFLKTILTTEVAWTLVVMLHYLFGYHFIGRWIVIIGAASCVLGATLARVILSAISLRYKPTALLVVGKSSGFDRDITENSGAAREMNFVWASPTDLGGIASHDGTLTAPNLPEFAKLVRADLVAFAPDLPSVIVDQAVHCLRLGIPVKDLGVLVEQLYGKVAVEHIDFRWLLQANMRLAQPLTSTLKRGMDVILAGLGLLLSLPLWPVVAVLVKVFSPGPVFYSQWRVGLGGKPFNLLKFRTMKVDAEAAGQAVWATENDPRITRIGSLLRKTRIDEIPQFLNVLRGDMSIVGPRPERPEYVEGLVKTIRFYDFRHSVKPGITGLAQVRYRYGATEADALEKLRYDLYYVRHSSLLLDLSIMIRTAGALMKGAR